MWRLPLRVSGKTPREIDKVRGEKYLFSRNVQKN